MAPSVYDALVARNAVVLIIGLAPEDSELQQSVCNLFLRQLVLSFAEFMLP